MFAEVLRRYLTVYWLRPATALQRALECDVIRKYEHLDDGVSLELACGDGVNTFLRCGGTVDFSFDAFMAVRYISPDEFFREQFDIYDVAFNEEYSCDRIVAQMSERTYSLAIDHKRNLLKKASLLGCYKQLKLGDLDQAIELVDESIDFVFSNSFYWFRNYNHVLREMRRVLKSNGRALLLIMNANYLNQMQHTVFSGYPFGKLLDRGRFEHCKSFFSEQQWMSLFKANGFKVIDSLPLMNRKLAFMVDGYDLREISPVLSQIRKHMQIPEFLELKSRFIDYVHYIYCNMWTDGFFDLSVGDNCYNLFQLEKTNE